MSHSKSRTSWQLPPGIPKGAWDYARADFISSNYDDYFRDHPLLEFDIQVASKWIFSPGLLIDYGCGTGRALQEIDAPGIRRLGIDLSQSMLETTKSKVPGTTLLRANLAELQCLSDRFADYSICLFSTLGMIQGHQHRRNFLQHAFRILKPGGIFIAHVHNRWFNLYDPHGPWSVLRDLLGKNPGKEPGDRIYDYRGIRDFYLHVFTQREFRSLLCDRGFEIVDWIPLRKDCGGQLAWKQCLPSLRSSGWMAVARKPK